MMNIFFFTYCPECTVSGYPETVAKVSADTIGWCYGKAKKKSVSH